MIEEKDFKFYPNFLKAIDMLPEEQRAEACYQFCKFGVTGELPQNANLKMFCIGVSASVQKYQGRGGARKGAGRKPNNQKNHNNQNIQNNQKIHNEQTETKTKTKTKTKEEYISKAPDKQFVPPTLEDVKAYCKERNNNIDVQKFYDYYSAAEWHDNKGKPVKNWKQRIITWESNNMTEAKENNKNYSDDLPWSI